MANDLNYRIGVDASTGVAGIRQFGTAVKAELRGVDTALDDAGTATQRVARLLGQMADQAATDLAGLKRATDAVGDALGPELAAKIGRGGIADAVQEYRKLGLTFDDIEAGADDLAKTLGKVDAVRTDALESGLGRAALGTDQLSDSAKGAQNAFANMLGNSASSVGELLGVTGPAGQALGELAEKAADATLGGEGLASSLKSVVLAAGPIAAIGLVVGTLNNLFAAAEAKAAAAAARTKLFGDAMDGAEDKVANLSRTLKDNVDLLTKFDSTANGFGGGIVEGLSEIGAAIPGLGSFLGDAGKGITDLIPIMQAAGMTADGFAAAIENGGRVGDTWQLQLRAAAEAGKISADQYEVMLEAIGRYGLEADNARKITEFFNGTQEEQAAKTAAATKATQDAAQAQRDLANKTAATEKAAKDLDYQWDVLKGTLSDREALRGVADAFDEVKLRGQEAWDAAATGAADAEQKSRDYQTSLDEAKGRVIDLGRQLGLSIPEVKAMLLRIEDGGQIDRVEEELNIMARNRTMNLSIITAGGQGYLPRFDSSGRPAQGRGVGPAPPAGRGRAAGAGPAPAPAAAGFPDLVFPIVVANDTPAIAAVTVDLRGAILGSRYDVTRTIRAATRDGVRLAGSRNV